MIIPVYRPDETLLSLLDGLSGQSIKVCRILLINTERRHFERLADSGALERYPNLEVFHISKKEFDHGGTRRFGVEQSRGEIFVMMTQDAVPHDGVLIERLTKHLREDMAAGAAGDSPRTAVAYARQLPGEKCGILERFAREFNYPAESQVKSARDLPLLGIKTFFCSNVCAAYRRDVYDKLGGFAEHAIFNEDMIYAAGAVKAGFGIAYEAEALVCHSHDYSIRQQFGRNFDIGVSQAQHPEVFGGLSSESEGKKMVKAASAYLRKRQMSRKLPYFYAQCAGKYLGYLLGKHYRMLPRWLVLKCTTNREYWGQQSGSSLS